MGFSISHWAERRCAGDAGVRSGRRVLPSGRLREPLDAARRRTASSCQGRPKTFRAWQRRSIACRCSASRITSDLVQGLDASAPSGTRVVAVAGIARPERFFTTLREQGFEIVRELRFPDHHWFSSDDLDRIRTIAKEASADLVVTTEKDAVRVAPQSGWAVLPMTAVIEPARTVLLMAPGTAVRHRLEFAFARTVQACLRLLPMTAVRACGGALGAMVYVVDRFHRRIALDNLAQAFPSRSEAENALVCRGMFAHFGSLLLELIQFGALQPSRCWSAWRSRGRSASGRRISRARACCISPVTSATGRFRRSHSPLHAEPISVVARPLDNPHLHAMLERIRTCTGNAVIYRQGGLARCCASCSNRGVAMLIDQHLHSDAVSVEFFDRPAATTSALAALALRTGAPVIPVFALPLPGGRYRLIYDCPVPAPETKRAGRDSRVHAALHRRAGDVCASRSGSLAVDASAMARPGTCSR